MISSFFLACCALSIIFSSYTLAHYLVKDFIKTTKQPTFSSLILGIFLAGSLVTFWQLEPFSHALVKSCILFLLSVSIFTDLKALLIADLVTLYPIPLVISAAFMQLLPITSVQSIAGFLFAYTLLWSIDKITFKLTQKNALGQGDRDLLAFIGACAGITGAWFSLMLGSCIGSVIGLIMYISGKSIKNYHFPFGTFLSLGAVIYLLFEKNIVSFF